MRLSNATLHLLPQQISRPRYQRGATGIGIAHIGVGAFHKAHPADYTEDALAAAGGDWGIAGISLRRPAARDQLAPQDGLYTVAERDDNDRTLRVIGAIKSVAVAVENPRAVVELLAQRHVRIITMTITEKGYCLRPDDGALDLGHADIAHDLGAGNAPRSAIGVLGAAVALRNPYVDALSHLQLRALSALRAGVPDTGEEQRLRDLLLLTVNGVAAGLQNTG
jgi:fructuronate reductase